MGKLRHFASAETEEKQALLRAALLVDNHTGNDNGGGSPTIWKIAIKILKQSSDPYSPEEVDDFIISTDDTDWQRRFNNINKEIISRNG